MHCFATQKTIHVWFEWKKSPPCWWMCKMFFFPQKKKDNNQLSFFFEYDMHCFATQKTIHVWFKWKKLPPCWWMCKIHHVLMTYPIIPHISISAYTGYKHMCLKWPHWENSLGLIWVHLSQNNFFETWWYLFMHPVTRRLTAAYLLTFNGVLNAICYTLYQEIFLLARDRLFA